MTVAIGPSKRLLNSPNYKWWVYAAVAVGMFLIVMDQSGLGIALPRIAEHFSADIPTVQWLTLGYVLSTSATLMPVGGLSDIVGRKQVYVVGFLIFMGAAALAGSGQTLTLLIVAKVVQGVGSAGVQANGMAMVAGVFPEQERGKALGLYMAVIGAGSISGPIVGGLLVSGLGWRSIFFASVPVGFIAVASAMAVLRGRESTGGADSKRPRFDWAGAGMSSGALISFLLAMTNAHRLGWDSPPIVAGFIIACLLILAFIWWELRVEDPMLDLDFFRSKVFSIGVSARFLSFLGGTSVFFLMPFYLIQGLDFTASKAGLLMVPGPICMAVMGPISGRLSDKVGTRWITVIGMALSATALFTFSRLTVESSPVQVMVGMMFSGLGFGVFSAANTSAILSSLDRERYGIASAFLNLTRTSANVTGVAVATIIVTLTMTSLGHEPSLAAVADGGGEAVKKAFVSGMDKAFLTAGSFALLGMVLSALRAGAFQRRPSRIPPVPESRSSSSTATED